MDVIVLAFYEPLLIYYFSFGSGGHCVKTRRFCGSSVNGRQKKALMCHERDDSPSTELMKLMSKILGPMKSKQSITKLRNLGPQSEQLLASSQA
jgi:hypothetical protein